MDARPAGRWEPRPRATRRWSALLLLPLLLLAACAGTYASMRSEAELKPYGELLQARRNGKPERRVVVVDEVDGVPVHAVVEMLGSGDTDRVLVFVHGIMSDRRFWRYMEGDLEHDQRMISIDLPGSGESDAPDPELMDHGYSPDAQAARVWRALASVFEDRPAAHITLVGHSLGGAVVIRMLGDARYAREFADLRPRVDGAVLFAPLDFALEQPIPELLDVQDVSSLELFLGNLFGQVTESVAKSCVDGVWDGSNCPREEADRMLEIFDDGDRLRALQATIHETLPWTDELGPDWEARAAFLADYANVDVPTLIVWGEQDDTLPVASGYAQSERLPDARLCVLRQAKHSIPVEHPLAAARLVRSFADPLRRATVMVGVWSPADVHE